MKTMLKTRLETTLLLSRLGLTRPHRRYYSTPSKPRAAAAATATVPREGLAPPPPPMATPYGFGATELESFLKRGIPSTFLPTPKPEGSAASSQNNVWFMDTSTQDQLAIMDACLHNLYDVPRAKNIFERMRSSRNTHALDPKIYNAILEGYSKMAGSRKDIEEKNYWLECFWDLYEVMETGKENVAATASTYANVLWTWYTYVKEFLQPHHRFLIICVVSTRLQVYPPALRPSLTHWHIFSEESSTRTST